MKNEVSINRNQLKESLSITDCASSGIKAVRILTDVEMEEKFLYQLKQSE